MARFNPYAMNGGYVWVFWSARSGCITVLM